MGYQSDIVIALSKETVFKDNLLTKNLPKLLKKYHRGSKGDAFYWLIEDFKWYDNYPEVIEVDNYLAQLKNEEYGFIRIGEDNDDYEYRGCPWDYDVYFNRHIEFPAEDYFKG